VTTSSSKEPASAFAPVGPANAKASVYARFIPREELSSFSAWDPGDLGAAPAASGAARASSEAAHAGAAEQLAEQLRLVRQSGYQDGYRDGLVALEGFKQSFARQATSQVGALLQSIGGQLDALQEEMAQALVQSAFGLARQVVRSELESRPEAAIVVAREAIDSLLLSARHITLRVHPDDHAHIVEGAGDVLAARGARLVVDATLARGGCVVESDIGVVDASIETRWLRAVAALGGQPPWPVPEAG
jgi:flagellar assembly protein FliH